MSCYLGFEPTGEANCYFISYNSEDVSRVAPLAKGLFDDGVPIWYDYGLEYGKEWERQIALRIKTSRAVVLFLTRGVLEKENSYVRKEYEMATTYFQKQVFVVMMDAVDVKSVPTHSIPWWMEVIKNQCVDIRRVLTLGEQIAVIKRAIGAWDISAGAGGASLPDEDEDDGVVRTVQPLVSGEADESEESQADEQGYSIGLAFTRVGFGGYAVSGRGTCKAREISIPPRTPEGAPVVAIADRAFWGCEDLRAVTIPESVRRIGKGAFAWCSSLVSVLVHNNNPVYYSMDNCVMEKRSKRLILGIRTSRIPEGVTAIGEHAFCGCKAMTSLVLPDSVTRLEDFALAYCTGLTVLQLPPRLMAVGSYALAGCDCLTGLTIPRSVVSLGKGFLFNCTALVGLEVEKGNPRYISRDNCIVDRKAMKLVQGSQDCRIPDGVISIGDFAFHGCRGLTEITVPMGVTSIGHYAFSGCRELATVHLPPTLASIGRGAFDRCRGLVSMVIPEGVTALAAGAFSNCRGLREISVHPMNPVYHSRENCVIEKTTGRLVVGIRTSRIPDEVVTIGDRAFEGCGGLPALVIPVGVYAIGRYAFSGCRGLASVMLPGQVTYIGQYAFGGCGSLTAIRIPRSVQTVEKGAFAGCKALILNCESPRKPRRWSRDWNPENRPIAWRYRG